MPKGKDDDTIIIGGPLKYWLAYRVWGAPGWVFVLAAFLAGIFVRALI